MRPLGPLGPLGTSRIFKVAAVLWRDMLGAFNGSSVKSWFTPANARWPQNVQPNTLHEQVIRKAYILKTQWLNSKVAPQNHEGRECSARALLRSVVLARRVLESSKLCKPS